MARRPNEIVEYDDTQLGGVTCVAQRMQELPVGALIVDYRYVQERKDYGYVFQVVTRACFDEQWYGHPWLYVWNYEHLLANDPDALNDLETIRSLSNLGDDTNRYTGGFYSFDPWNTIMLRVIEASDPNLEQWLHWIGEQMEAAAA